MSKTYRQYDSRWGKKNYNGSSTMAAAGCGPTSCACIAYNMDTSITPITTMKFMQKNGYAIRNNGTAWAGIPACLKHFGCDDVQNPKTMAEAYKIMAKKGYCAVFLFRGGSRGGVTWTTSGHYLAVTDYKESNGKHYFFMRDPGQRKHDGWYCYETTMQGLIPEIWTCHCSKLNGKDRVTTIPTVSKTPKADTIVSLAKKYAYTHETASRKSNYSTGAPKSAYKEALNKAYPKREWSKPARLGASCDVFVGTVIRNAGIDKKFHRGLSEQWSDFKKTNIWKEVSLDKVKAGDIIIYNKSGGGGHICIALKERVAEAGYQHFFPKIGGKVSTRINKSGKSKIKAYRVKE